MKALAHMQAHDRTQGAPMSMIDALDDLARHAAARDVAARSGGTSHRDLCPSDRRSTDRDAR
jgi:hypothetical protein